MPEDVVHRGYWGAVLLAWVLLILRAHKKKIEMGMGGLGFGGGFLGAFWCLRVSGTEGDATISAFSVFLAAGAACFAFCTSVVEGRLV